MDTAVCGSMSKNLKSVKADLNHHTEGSSWMQRNKEKYIRL